MVDLRIFVNTEAVVRKKLNSSWESGEHRGLPKGMTEESLNKGNEESLARIAEYNNLRKIIVSSRVVNLEGLTTLTNPGKSYVIIEVPPNFMTSTRDIDRRRFIFEQFKVLMVSQAIISREDLTYDDRVKILVTGKANTKHRDSEIVIMQPSNVYADPSEAWNMEGLSLLDKTDRFYGIYAEDPHCEYFNFGGTIESIRTGYRPPRANERDGDFQIEMLGPENFNGWGDIVGSLQPYKTSMPERYSEPLVKGDLLFVAAGGNLLRNELGRIGYCALIDEPYSNGKYFPNHYLFRIKLKPTVDPCYILFAMGEGYIRLQLRDLVRKSGAKAVQMRLTKDYLLHLKIKKLPNMSEIGREFKLLLAERRVENEKVNRLRE